MPIMRHQSTSNPIAILNLLPFLDIIFATIGIFIVVFALQEMVSNANGRLLAVDSMVICTSDREIAFYPDATAKLQHFNDVQIPLLFSELAKRGGGIHNLVFAFTRNCFKSRQRFENEFSKFTALFHDRQDRKTAFRLEFRPLSIQADATEKLLATWRDESSEYANP